MGSLMINSLLVLYILLFTTTGVSAQSSDISAKEIISHIRFLASDELAGRKSGQEGCEKAADYIASHFKKAGLKPLGDSDTYFQHFTFPAGVELGKTNSLVFKTDVQELKLEVSSDFLPLSFSNDGKIAADLVFAGYGITAKDLNYDDYEGLDVKDKIVIALRYAPEEFGKDKGYSPYTSLYNKAITAKQKGAKGIIFTTPYRKEEEKDLGGLRFDFTFATSDIHATVVRRQSVEKLFSILGLDLKDTENKITAHSPNSFAMYEVRVHQQTELQRLRSNTYNVIGLIEAADKKPETKTIIIGAHYDHLGHGGVSSLAKTKKGQTQIHNGADDNASGTAGLIEIAEYFASNKDSLNFNLVFIAFSGEELGLLGSSYYIKNPKVPLEQTTAMINMDMIGRLRHDNLVILGTGSSPQWHDLLKSANADVGLKLKNNDTGFAPSDQSVFYARKTPVLQFFTGVHSEYHTPEDDWQKINADGQVKILNVITNLVWNINNNNLQISYSSVKGDSADRPTRFNVYLGTIPDYSDESEGMKLMGVKENGPAEKAGIKGGDIIIKLGSKSIKNIYDYVYALSEMKANVPTEIVVLRGGKKISLNIVAEPRRSKMN